SAARSPSPATAPWTSLACVTVGQPALGPVEESSVFPGLGTPCAGRRPLPCPDAAHRARDALRLRSLQHRQRARLRRSREEARRRVWPVGPGPLRRASTSSRAAVAAVTSSANGFAAKMSRGSFFWRNFITVLNIALKRHCSLIGGAGRF